MIRQILNVRTYIEFVFFFVIMAFPALAVPPEVVRTEPKNGQQDVDPKLRQIRIEFNQEMSREGYSICGSGPKYPKTTGEPRWINRRTIVMGVKLEPNHEYELSVNCPSYKRFTNIEGEAAAIYPIQFRTGSVVRSGESENIARDGNGPPEVIKTVPENGAKDVEPSLKEIRVVFGQDMSTDRGGFSICGGGTNFPNIIGNPRWFDKRTIIMRVELLPNHEYQFSINCPGAKNFRSAKGEAAVPYPVQFRTGSGTNKPSVLTAAVNEEAIKELHRAINENYSYYKLRGIDWDGLFDRYNLRMRQAKTIREFAEAAGELLAHAEDVHIWVKIGEETIGGFKRNIKVNYNRETLEKVVPNWQKRNSAVCTGRFEDGIGYILIDSWSREQTEAIKQVYVAIGEFSDAPGLIIDVRPNSGGAEPLAGEVAGCFVDEPVLYAKHVYRAADEPNGFSKTSERILQPNKTQRGYRGKIAVLMGQGNMSSCEAFLLMMKQVPGCKLVGERSYGSSGNPKPDELGNGVTVYLPSWKDMRPDGSCFEGEGIEPDIPVGTTPARLLNQDPVLDTALKFLRKP